MAEPWFDATKFGIYLGAIGGGLGGPLLGLLGAAAGTLVPKGKAKPLILGGFCAFLCIGLGLLVIGLVALATGQPYMIWYSLMLTGFIASVITGSLLPVVIRGYRQAEARRMEAEGLRGY